MPFNLRSHSKNVVRTGADKRPAIVSGIVIGNAPVSYWTIFSPVPDVFAKVYSSQFLSRF